MCCLSALGDLKQPVRAGQMGGVEEGDNVEKEMKEGQEDSDVVP